MSSKLKKFGKGFKEGSLRGAFVAAIFAGIGVGVGAGVQYVPDEVFGQGARFVLTDSEQEHNKKIEQIKADLAVYNPDFTDEQFARADIWDRDKKILKECRDESSKESRTEMFRCSQSKGLSHSLKNEVPFAAGTILTIFAVAGGIGAMRRKDELVAPKPKTAEPKKPEAPKGGSKTSA